MILPEYFTDTELNCRCNCGLKPNKEAIEKLYALRLIYGKPIKINSGVRCGAYNFTSGGSLKSRHIKGIAFDIAVPPEDEIAVLKIALNIGFKGVGINNNTFIHLDLREDNEQLWTY